MIEILNEIKNLNIIIEKYDKNITIDLQKSNFENQIQIEQNLTLNNFINLI